MLIIDMSERLKIFTKKLLNNIKVQIENPQQSYDYLTSFIKNRREFFSDMDPNEIIKISLYIYSFKSTGSFDLAEEIFEKLEFITIISTDEEQTILECPKCDGAGDIYCDYCDGTGSGECGECDGDGIITCTDCDGDGEVEGVDGMEQCHMCAGTGEVDCEECSGRGTTHCQYCDNGRRECFECDGSGEIESPDHDNFECANICSWSKILNEKAELEEQSKEPLSVDGSLVENNNEVIWLSQTEISLEPSKLMEKNYYYCVYVDDSPKLYWNPQMRVGVHLPADALYIYGEP
jgi:hypothetical protein